MFNFTEEELENRTAINKALKRRWSTESTDSMKITKAQQKIRRFSAFEAEGTQIYSIVNLFCKNGFLSVISHQSEAWEARCSDKSVQAKHMNNSIFIEDLVM